MADNNNIEYAKIQVRRGNEVDLPLLDEGEPGFTTDTKKPFIGTGSGNIELAKKQDLDKVQSDVSKLTEDTTSFKSNTEAKFQSLEQSIAGISNTVDTEVSSLKTKDTELEVKINNNVSSLQSQINSSVSSLQNQISSEVDTLQKKDSELQNSIDSLDSKVETKVTELRQKDEELSAQLAQTETKELESTGYGVVHGLLVRHQPIVNADMSVQVDAGIAHMPNGKRFKFNPVSRLPIEPAHATLRRKDIVYISSDGVISYLKGIPAELEEAPQTPEGGLLLGVVTVKPGVNAIYHSDVKDERLIKEDNNKLKNNLQELRQTNALSIRPSEGLITKMFNYAQTYVVNRDKFTYGGRDAFDEGELYVSPEGKFEATCSTFCHLVAKGIPFEKSRYSGLTENIPDPNFNDIIEVGNSMVAYEWAEWAYNNGYGYVPDPDFKNVMPGDILFFSWADPSMHLQNHDKAFMNVDHSATFVNLHENGNFDVYEITNIPTFRTYGTERKKEVVYACRLPYNSIDLNIENIVDGGNESKQVRGSYFVGEYPLSKPMKNQKWYTVVIKADIQTEGCYFNISNGQTLLYRGNQTGIREDGLYTFHFNTSSLNLSANTLRITLVADSEAEVPESTRNADVEWIVMTEGFTKSITEYIPSKSSRNVNFTFEVGYEGYYNTYYSDDFCLLTVRLTNPSVITDGQLVTVGTITGSTLKTNMNIPCDVVQTLTASPSYAKDMTVWIATDSNPFRLRVKNGTTQNMKFVDFSCVIPI